ncbi:putative membrane protein [Lactobacillus colini]|uniref:Membrane protein n=1 Tax=Lactobacillus colini TaxID=1819254 RepID=A0ABS4MGX3_9LACO|nr:hypothetical protein [Lactobacillus colini]MBP2058950.1 putative membrane protein [Lactobacillus colini]
MDKNDLECSLIRVNSALKAISHLADELSSTPSIDEVSELASLIEVTQKYTNSLTKKF